VRHAITAVLTVRHIFSGGVLTAEAPEIGRIDPLAAIAKAIVALPAEQHALEAPIRLLVEVLRAQSVLGARFPVAGRIPDNRLSRRHVYRPMRERITVVQMRRETATGFQVMNGPDEIPGNAPQLFADRLVTPLELL